MERTRRKDPRVLSDTETRGASSVTCATEAEVEKTPESYRTLKRFSVPPRDAVLLEVEKTPESYRTLKPTRQCGGKKEERAVEKTPESYRTLKPPKVQRSRRSAG